MIENEPAKIQPKDHHKQLNLCTTRLPYRQGRTLTAVKVYTINDESQHLLITKVPALNLRSELMRLCGRFGNVLKLHTVPDYPNEEFTECFHATYERIQSARIAKRLIDTKNFYGGVLHVCYAPELETVEQTRQKLEQRRREVKIRILKNQNDKRNQIGIAVTTTDENMLEDLRDSIFNSGKPVNRGRKRKR